MHPYTSYCKLYSITYYTSRVTVCTHTLHTAVVSLYILVDNHCILHSPSQRYCTAELMLPKPAPETLLQPGSYMHKH